MSNYSLDWVIHSSIGTFVISCREWVIYDLESSLLIVSENRAGKLCPRALTKNSWDELRVTFLPISNLCYFLYSLKLLPVLFLLGPSIIFPLYPVGIIWSIHNLSGWSLIYKPIYNYYSKVEIIFLITSL